MGLGLGLDSWGLRLLSVAGEEGMVPSKNSSLGVGFHNALSLWDVEMQVFPRGVEEIPGN